MCRQSVAIAARVVESCAADPRSAGGDEKMEKKPAETGFTPDFKTHAGQKTAEKAWAHAGQKTVGEAGAHAGQTAAEEAGAHAGQKTVGEAEAHAGQTAADEAPFTAAVITLSDKGSRGDRKDESGPAAAAMLEEAGYEVVEAFILPDEPELLKKELIRLADEVKADLVLTSGGTGFSMRDQTPEATMAVADRNAPGIAEYIRMRSSQITDRAMLSRGVSVIRKGTLIVNLPGSPKAVRESLGFILGALDHGLRILRGSASECARK